MIMTRFLRALLPVFCTALLLASCEKEPTVEPDPQPDPQPTAPYISVSPNGTVSFPSEGGDVKFTINTNLGTFGYSFSKRDWMRAAFDQSDGKDCVVITLQANTSGEERSNDVTFYAARESGGEREAEVKVKVVQAPMAGGGVPKVETSVQVDFGGGSQSVAGCEILTSAGSFTASGNGAVPVSVLIAGGIPQPTLVCNAKGDVVLMARDIRTSATDITVDVRSSALAMVTMYPLFAPVLGESEFGQLKEMIMGASSYAAFEKQVADVVKAGKPLFDTANKNLNAALETLLNEVCLSPDTKPLTKVANVGGIEGEGPFKVEVNGKRVSISNCGLTPMYEGAVYDPDDNKVADLNIPAGEDYGLTSLYFRYGNMKYGDPVVFDFSNLSPEGEYLLYFSRLTTSAKVDLAVNVMCNFLDVLGAKLSCAQMKTLQGAIAQYLVARGMALVQMLADGKATFGEIIEAVSAAMLDFVQSEYFIKVAEGTTAAAIQAACKKLSLSVTIYCGVRGGANALGRTYCLIESPGEISFCLCHVGKQPLSSCSYVTVELVSGDKQKDVSQKWLDDPIVVKVKTGNNTNPAPYFIVRFTVLDGGGQVSETEVYTDDDLQASTWWMLGQECETQVLVVDVLDPVTRGVISEEHLFVSATATDINLNKAPIPMEMQGEWRWTREDKEMKPIEITLTEHTATFRNLEDPRYDFTGISVWFEVETLPSGSVDNHIRFYDIDPATGDCEMFLRNVNLHFSEVTNTKTLFVDDVWGQGFGDFCLIPADGPLPNWLWDEFAKEWDDDEYHEMYEVDIDLFGGGNTRDLLNYFYDLKYDVKIAIYVDDPPEPVRFVHTGWNIFGYEIGDVYLVGSGECLMKGAQMSKSLDGVVLHVDDLYGPRGSVDLFGCGIADF